MSDIIKQKKKKKENETIWQQNHIPDSDLKNAARKKNSLLPFGWTKTLCWQSSEMEIKIICNDSVGFKHMANHSDANGMNNKKKTKKSHTRFHRRIILQELFTCCCCCRRFEECRCYRIHCLRKKKPEWIETRPKRVPEENHTHTRWEIFKTNFNQNGIGKCLWSINKKHTTMKYKQRMTGMMSRTRQQKNRRKNERRNDNNAIVIIIIRRAKKERRIRKKAHWRRRVEW